MEKFVKNLFDYQKIANNQKLAAMIDKTESMYGDGLSEAELENVTAGFSANKNTALEKEKISLE